MNQETFIKDLREYKIPRYYDMTIEQIKALHDSADGNHIFTAIDLAFKYGFKRGKNYERNQNRKYRENKRALERGCVKC